MAENLNYKTTDSYCYDDKDSNCKTYGRLYTWQAAKSACLSGWHLPSDNEWKQLEMYLGMSQTEADKIMNDPEAGKTLYNHRGTNEGNELKATSGWYSTPLTKGNGINKYGFTALPSGYRSTNGAFDSKSLYCGWWSATESSAGNALKRVIFYDKSYVYKYTDSKSNGYSVRCVRD